MSPIGRVFIILNLILAGAFLGWASAALSEADDFKQQYQDEATSHGATSTQLGDELSALRTSLEEEQRAKDGLRNDRDTEKARADRNQSDLADAKRQTAQQAGDIAGIKEALTTLNSTLASVTTAKDTAQQEARDAERERDAAVAASDAAQTAQRDAEEEARSASNRISDLEGELAGSEATVARMEAQVQTYVDKYGEVLTGVPKIDGSVLGVSDSYGLVMLNVGADDQVKRGMKFSISSGKLYKGEVRVENVDSDSCSALVITPYPGRQISTGDRATTRL